jgi:PAS domain S-box-containing protein
MSEAPAANPSTGRAWDEAERLQALRDLGVLDSEREPEFDDLANVAAHVFQAPVALVSLVEDTRQWFKAEIGLGMAETPLSISICAHAIRHPGMFVVPDMRQDPRFKDNPLVTGEPHLRFYAGASLLTRDGLPLGTLCVLDHESRLGITPEQAQVLQALAKQVMTQLEHRQALQRLVLREAELAESERRFSAIADGVPQIVWSMHPNGQHDYINRRWFEFTGLCPRQSVEGDWTPIVHPDDRARAWTAWQQALATGKPYEIEYRLRAKCGSYRWFVARALPVRNEQGEIERWSGTSTDIHDFKQAG